jgi:hypothetical protein
MAGAIARGRKNPVQTRFRDRTKDGTNHGNQVVVGDRAISHDGFEGAHDANSISPSSLPAVESVTAPESAGP